jgi:NADP-dependent 3-hydroxy acid dehydrogenase YdfG
MTIDKNFQTTDINGINVLITGGTTGIGRAIALLLLQQGANVIITGQDQSHMDDALQDFTQIESQGAISGVISDLATKDGILQLFKEVDSRFGKLDVLINNAGLAHGSVMEGTYEDWQRVVSTNLLSYIACTHYAIDRMRVNHSGHIINVGSMSAEALHKGTSVYVATKSGVRGFSASLRKEANELGIRVTLIEPGSVGSDMQGKSTEEQQEKIEKLEMLEAEDIAASVVYILTQPQRCDVVELKIRPLLELI